MTTPTAIIGPAPATGALSGIVRQPTISCAWGTTMRTSLPVGLADPTTITNVLAAHTSVGVDSAVADASFVVPTLGDLHGAAAWHIVSLQLSAGGGTPVPWCGYITDIDQGLYPRAVAVTCKGFLIRAEMQANRTPGGLLPLAPLPGGNQDDLLVNVILGQCGLVMPPLSLQINGCGRTFGTVAREPFRWAEGETGLSYIQRLDEVSFQAFSGSWMAYRTFDDVGGYIKRTPIDAVPGVSAAATFTEGVDIFTGSGQQSVLPIRNQVNATGFDPGDGTGAVQYSAAVASSYIPTPPQYVTLQLSNPMIERATEASAGLGMSAEAVCNGLLYQWNRLQKRVAFTTPRDDHLGVAATIAVATPGGSADRLGMVGTFWLQHIDRDIDARGTFTQSLVAIAGGV